MLRLTKRRIHALILYAKSASTNIIALLAPYQHDHTRADASQAHYLLTLPHTTLITHIGTLISSSDLPANTSTNARIFVH